MTDTIFALASAQGRAGVSIVRVSGPDAFQGLRTLAGHIQIEHRRVMLKTLLEPVSRGTIDVAVVITFCSPHSYTGEDVVEYHLHGSAAVLKEMFRVLSNLEGHRFAQAGEFTKRAFENNKIDLTEAEAIADLINSETSLQKAQALSQMQGCLSHFYEQWKDRLIHMLAFAEAELEFPDEDLPINIIEHMKSDVLALIDEIQSHLKDNRRGELLRNGLEIAVIGAPNVGKSSLVNSLAQRNVAIVSEFAGTTRDVIEVSLDIGGYPVLLSDTAGLRPDQLSESAQDRIESEGIRRAIEKARQADIKIFVYDASIQALDKNTFLLEQEFNPENCLIVANKTDQGLIMQHPNVTPVPISVLSGEGFNDLLDRLIKKIESLIGFQEGPVITRERHRKALIDTVDSLNRSLNSELPELFAEDLRLSIRYLGRIVGKVDVEDLLDIVFRDFCIGK